VGSTLRCESAIESSTRRGAVLGVGRDGGAPAGGAPLVLWAPEVGARPGGGPVAGVLAALFAGGPAGRPGGGVLGAGDPLVAGGPGGRAAGGALMGLEGLPLTIGITQWDTGHSPAGVNDAVVLRSSHTYKIQRKAGNTFRFTAGR
jgi:hypothetical protein